LKFGLTPAYSIDGITDWASLKYKDIPEKKDSNWDTLTINHKKGFRLPTEAEWEYAARHCKDDETDCKDFAGCAKEDLKNYAWHVDNSGGKTHEVGTASKTKELRLHDMSGNVWEWCECMYNKKSSYRVCRGGGWSSNAWGCRVVARGGNSPSNGDNNLGFRVVLP
jgi:formylglycine-generating enzyme required for sulfatase activity